MCSEYYTTSSLINQYDDSVRPVGVPEDWDVPKRIRDIVIHPPLWIGRAGRPKNRIPSAGDYKSKKGVAWRGKAPPPTDRVRITHCSLCKMHGHYRQNCPNPSGVAPSPVKRRHNSKQLRKCSKCHQSGHNKATCPNVASTS